MRPSISHDKSRRSRQILAYFPSPQQPLLLISPPLIDLTASSTVSLGIKSSLAIHARKENPCSLPLCRARIKCRLARSQALLRRSNPSAKTGILRTNAKRLLAQSNLLATASYDRAPSSCTYLITSTSDTAISPSLTISSRTGISWRIFSSESTTLTIIGASREIESK